MQVNRLTLQKTMAGPAQLTQKLWNLCAILRDDGMSYGDYVEQLTYLLFLKTAEEHSKPPFLYLAPLAPGADWNTLASADSAEIQLQIYERILRELSNRDDLFGIIYKHALSKFRDPYKFQRLVHEISTVNWTDYDSDVKGDAYEGLLQKTASEGKAGAGQYFTPRPLVDTIAQVMRPTVEETVFDPACGTGGFLLAAFRYCSSFSLGAKEKKRLREQQLTGVELVDSVARLCLMNLVLHGIGGEETPVLVQDSLAKPPTKQYDLVLANPPFGRQSTGSVAGQSRRNDPNPRPDFWVQTSNKQLNFLQHIFTLLKPGGRAAVVLPDNVLFEGGAGEVIRRNLVQQARVHTLLRLPTGIFYAQGVKANVLFFEKPVTPTPEASTEHLWIYDFRTNVHFTLKDRPLIHNDLSDFIQSYGTDKSARQEHERFRAFSAEQLLKRDKANLDIFWIADETFSDLAATPVPDKLAVELMEDLQAAVEQLALIHGDLAGSNRIDSESI